MNRSENSINAPRGPAGKAPDYRMACHWCGHTGSWKGTHHTGVEVYCTVFSSMTGTITAG